MTTRSFEARLERLEQAHSPACPLVILTQIVEADCTKMAAHRIATHDRAHEWRRLPGESADDFEARAVAEAERLGRVVLLFSDDDLAV